MDLSNLTPNQLHEVYLSGNEQSSEAGWLIVEVVEPWIKEICAGYSTQEATIEDLVSNLRIMVFESLSKWNPSAGSLTNWVKMIAVRKIPRTMRWEHGPVQIRSNSKIHKKKEYELRPEATEEDYSAIFERDDVDSIYGIMSQILSERERSLILGRCQSISFESLAMKHEITAAEARRTYDSAIVKLKNYFA